MVLFLKKNIHVSIILSMNPAFSGNACQDGCHRFKGFWEWRSPAKYLGFIRERVGNSQADTAGATQSSLRIF